METEELNKTIEDLEQRLREAEELIEAIKADSVDAFAVKSNGQSHIRTLENIDYTYSLLIEKMNEGALSMSEEGLIFYCNDYFLKLLNISSDASDAITGTNILDFIDEGSKEEFKSLLSTAGHGHSKGEIIMGSDGNQIPVAVSLTSLQPQLQAIGMVVTDLIIKRKNESLIHQYQVELEDKIKLLNEANKELEQFAYIISHDLKEPVRKIATFSDLLTRGLSDAKNSESHLSADIIKSSALRLKAFIDDLLTFTMAANDDKKSYKEVNLNLVVQKVLEDLELPIREKHSHMVVDELPTVNGIPGQMSQLFQNLIMNALKYNKTLGSPEIRIHSEVVDGSEINKEGAKYYKISVRDNGIGFEPGNKDRIFTIFQRLHNQKEFSGTGIGLAICKRIAENHSGVITADSQLGKGAIFTLYLPV